MKIINALVVLFTAVNSLLLARVEAADSIGKVLAVEGHALAGERELFRGAAIYLSDTIQVAAASKVQIKFTDGGILNLIESTQYRIDSYIFDKKGKSTYAAELLEGGFRASSGSIGKKDIDDYVVQTPTATIGIRGTVFEANIEEGNTSFGCESGKVTISNEAGKRVLGSGQFVSAASTTQLGEITHIRPASLSSERFTPAKEGAAAQKAAKPLPSTQVKEKANGKEPKSEVHELHIPAKVGNPSC